MKRSSGYLVVILATALTVLGPVAVAQSASLTVRVESHPTGRNADSWKPTRIVADQFETGEARVQVGEIDQAPTGAGNTDVFRLSPQATAGILELVERLDAQPEPEARSFRQNSDGKITISFDTTSSEIWITRSGVEAHFWRDGGADGRVTEIAGELWSGVVARRPPELPVIPTAITNWETAN